jgi:5-methylcytosine-specific restriction protein A
MTSLRGHDRSEFSQKVRADALRRCADDYGIYRCETCHVAITAATGIRFEHVDADGLGGRPTLANCKVHCKNCAKAKDKIDNSIMRKADRVLKKSYGLRPPRKKIQSRAFAITSPQYSASRPIRRRQVDA